MNITEKTVLKFYKSIFITSPDQLGIDNISRLINLPVHYWEYSSEVVYYKGKYKMFINENQSSQRQWQDFGHEMNHVIWHEGRQEHMATSFINHQECQANYFAYHFCVPTFMLDELGEVTVYDVMNLFNVEFDFAYRRLEMYRNKLCQRIS